MGKVMFLKKGEVHTIPEPPAPDVGTIWLYTSNGTFEVPANGSYQVEMHGGGGGGGGGGNASSANYRISNSQCGGASGNLTTLTLTKGETYAITIGSGGAGGKKSSLSYDETSGWSTATGATNGSNGGTTYFGTYSVRGGQGGKAFTGYVQDEPKSYGNIATASDSTNLIPGEGNKNNTAQTYGDGGAAGRLYNYYDTSYVGNTRCVSSDGGAGKPGAVIITYLGKE